MSTDTNPFIKAGRLGALRRWAGRTQADKDASAAHMREALRARAVSRAREQAARLGIILTDEQAEAAGAQLLQAEQRDRIAHARVAGQAAKAARKAERDREWALEQAAAYADVIGELLPTTDGRQHAHYAACLLAIRDEEQSPDGFNRTRLIRRLAGLVSQARMQARAGLN